MTTTSPPQLEVVLIRVDALKAARITAAQLLHAVYEEEGSLAPTPFRPEQAVVVSKRALICMRVTAVIIPMG